MTMQGEDVQATDDEYTGVYVYGIMPGGIEVESGATGVGDPPGEVRAIRHRDLVALVSDVRLDGPLGRAEDLVTHEELLDSSSAYVPVLPLRFGAVVSDDDAVTAELLGPHHDEFAAALRQLEGQAEYVVRGRYIEQAVLQEVLAGSPQAARLAEQLRDADPDATRSQRIELGEFINNAVTAKRDADNRTLGKALSGHVTASVIRPPTHELDAVYGAFLVETDKADELREAVGRLAEEWRDRIELRLLGPLAAYDFTGTAAPASSTTTTTT
jgi:Gas vesicle synthesis protein GvpL/GvpF